MKKDKVSFCKKYDKACILSFESPLGRNQGISTSLIEKAREELGYSKTTASSDIYSSLRKAYSKMMTV